MKATKVWRLRDWETCPNICQNTRAYQLPGCWGIIVFTIFWQSAALSNIFSMSGESCENFDQNDFLLDVVIVIMITFIYSLTTHIMYNHTRWHDFVCLSVDFYLTFYDWQIGTIAVFRPACFTKILCRRIPLFEAATSVNSSSQYKYKQLQIFLFIFRHSLSLIKWFARIVQGNIVS